MESIVRYASDSRGRVENEVPQLSHNRYMRQSCNIDMTSLRVTLMTLVTGLNASILMLGAEFAKRVTAHCRKPAADDSRDTGIIRYHSVTCKYETNMKQISANHSLSKPAPHQSVPGCQFDTI